MSTPTDLRPLLLTESLPGSLGGLPRQVEWVGGGTPQKRHHLRLFPSVIRSIFLILCSFTASTTSTATAAQIAHVSALSTSNNGAIACIAADSATLFALIVWSSLLTVGLMALLLLIWHGFILPRVELSVSRRTAKRLDKGQS